MEKLCSKCKIILTDQTSYRKGKAGPLNSYCKKCFNRFCTDRFRKKKEEAINYLGGSCQLCGYNKCIAALEFHHENPKEKDHQIFKNLRSKKWELMKLELDKCKLLCSNCHRESHYFNNDLVPAQTSNL